MRQLADASKDQTVNPSIQYLATSDSQILRFHIFDKIIKV